MTQGMRSRSGSSASESGIDTIHAGEWSRKKSSRRGECAQFDTTAFDSISSTLLGQDWKLRNHSSPPIRQKGGRLGMGFGKENQV